MDVYIEMKHYLDVTTLAERLGIKRSTLYAWAEQGTIPHVKLGRLLRFDPDEIDVWIQAHHRNFAPEPTPRQPRSGTDCIDALIAQAKREVYNPLYGKPSQDRATRKGENDGSV